MTQLGAGEKRTKHQFTENQSLRVEQGDDLLFDDSIHHIARLAKKGVHLQLDFEDGTSLTLEYFFHLSKPNVESVLTFPDALYTAEEIAACFEDEATQEITLQDLLSKRFHAGAHILKANGKVRGGRDLNALESAPFVYQFTIADEFPDDAKVNITINDEPAPAWLTLKKMGERQYLLSGTPAHEHAGEMNLQIHVEV